MNIEKNEDGFTLIELLVVIGILAILLAITLIAINPNKHFEDVRNTQRSSNVGAILDGIYEYESANNGNEPPSVANVSTTSILGTLANISASTTSYASPPRLIFTVPSGNIITDGTVTVTSCSQNGDNGTWSVLGGTSTTIEVSDSGGSSTPATGCTIGGWSGAVNVCNDLIPTYIAALPMDPSASSGTSCDGIYNTGYTISQTNGRFTISAPHAEDGATISVTR